MKNIYPSLSFLYNQHQQRMVFVSHSPGIFFGSPVDMQLPFPFNELIDEEDKALIAAEWHKCLLLADQQQHHFLFTMMNNGSSPGIFQVHASGLSMGNDPSSSGYVLFTVNKETGSQNTDRDKKEYDEFIDTAAHDLDAPLRKLGVFVERLTGKYQHGNGEVKDYVQRINNSLVAMRSLIDDLAVLSKVTEGTLDSTSCDLNEIVRELLQEMQPIIRNKKAIIHCSPLPVLRGDQTQFRLVFKNLLDNALKFTKKETTPSIQITAESITAEEKKTQGFPLTNDYYKITIADNGIGFDPVFAGKIFRPFIRLHPKSAFPGNGIGLAIVKRIIKNHGGIIYVYSTEHAGSRFIFILPKTIG